MKLSKIAALLALFSAALAAPSARAASYTAGDLFLGIRSSATNQDYLINIGSASQFSGQTGSVNVNGLGTGLGTIKTDLDSVFGSDWATSSTVYWSVSGGNLAADVPGTLYATRPRQTLGTPITPWKGNSASAQGVIATKFNQLAGGFINGTATANSNSKAVIQNTSGTNSYAFFQPAFDDSTGVPRTVGISYNYFGPTIEATATGGISTTELELFKIVPGFGRNGQSLGVLTIDANGTINFTPASTLSTSSVSLEFDAYSVRENDGTLVVKVIRGAGLTSTVSATVSTSTGGGGTPAVVNVDYQATSNTVTFNPSETEKTVTIPIISRDGPQGSRRFIVALSGVSAGSITPSPSDATVTILDQFTGSVAFAQQSYDVGPVDGHGDPSKITVTLNRTLSSTGIATVDVTADAGTLTSGVDYNALPATTVTFAEGVTTQTVDVQLKSGIADSKLPGSIILHISNPGEGTSVGETTTTINVGAADKVAPKITVTKPTNASSGTVTLAGVASDNKGIDRVAIILNGGAPQLATLIGSFSNGKQSYELPNVQLENGINAISVITYDSSGVPSKATALSLTYVNPLFAAKVGAYNGLAQVTLAADRTNSLSGILQNLIITKTGSFTGKLVTGDFTYTVTGIFRNNGAARFGKAPFTDILALSRKTKANPNATGATLALQLNLASADGQITGSLTDIASTKVAAISADRALFTSKTGTALTKLQLVAPYVNPDPTLIGSYTAIFQANNIPATQVDRDAATFPLGDGAVSIVVDKNGSVKVAGKLADGQTVSFSGPLSKAKELPFFAQLYKKTGSVSQKLSFVPVGNVDVSGTAANWFKPANAAGEKYYIAGWPAGITVDVTGAKYVAPPASVVLPGLNAGAATATFNDGSVPPVAGNRTLAQALTITDAGKATATAPNSATLKLTIAAKTGLFSGTFVSVTGAKTSSIYGAVLQKAPAGGAGFFLDPATQASPKSGGVSIEP